MFSGRCILRRFLVNLRLDRPGRDQRLPPLLTVAVLSPSFHGCSSRLRRTPLLPLLSGVGSKGVTRVRHLFRGPPPANEKGPRKSHSDGVSFLLRVGHCLSAHWRHCQTIGVGSWVLSVLRDGCRIPFLDSPPPLSCTPISFPTYRAGSPRSLALSQEVEKMLSKYALEIVSIRVPVSTVVFSWWKR